MSEVSNKGIVELWKNFCKEFFDVEQKPFEQFFFLMEDGEIDKICREYFLSVSSKVEEIQPKKFNDFESKFKKLVSILLNFSFLKDKEHFKNLKVLYGLPGSGKTTYALSLQSEQEYSVLSTDSFLKFLRDNSEILGGEPFNTLAANNDDFRRLELRTVFCLFFSGMLSDRKMVLDFGGAVMNQSLVRMLCYHLLSKENIELIEVPEEQRRDQLLFDATNPKCHARRALLDGFNELKRDAESHKKIPEFEAAIANIRGELLEYLEHSERYNEIAQLLQKIGKEIKRLEKTSSSKEFKELEPSKTGVRSEIVEEYKEGIKDFTKIKAEADLINGKPLIEIIEKEKKFYYERLSQRNSLNFRCV